MGTIMEPLWGPKWGSKRALIPFSHFSELVIILNSVNETSGDTEGIQGAPKWGHYGAITDPKEPVTEGAWYQWYPALEGYSPW